MTQNQAIINSMYSGEKDLNNDSKGKVYNYTLLDKYFSPYKRGTCKNVIRKYDPSNDCYIVFFDDAENGKHFSVCQFNIELEEIKAH